MEALAWIATVFTLGLGAGLLAAEIYMFFAPDDPDEYLH